MFLKLILPPVFGALIGWLTNYITIKMLFRPHVPMTVLGFKFQGLLPKKRKEIASKLALAIENELLTASDIASSLGDIDWKTEVERTVEEAVDHRMGSSVFSSMPVIGVLSENVKYHVKYLLTKEILMHLDRKKDSFTTKVKNSVNVGEAVAVKLDNLDLEKFEVMLTKFVSAELNHLAWLGGAIGLVVGAAHSAVFYFFL